jgi:transcriptional regulator with XRE-family HTH domain
MHTDLSLFRERVSEACKVRGITLDKLCASTGLGGRPALRLDIPGVTTLDIYSVCQIADALNVSLDWLLGRSDAMAMEGRQGRAID